jgi:nicotinamide mononucleotide transporter
MNFFDVNNIALDIWGYQISYVELIGTVFGVICVYYASKTNILTWPTGIVNLVFLFILFYQIQLYADMFLQIYFFVVTIYGWYNWSKRTSENKVSKISSKSKVFIAFCIGFGTIIAGYLLAHIHIYLPNAFALPADYPYLDSFIMVTSIIATVLLARKKIENWYLWLAVDFVCVWLYFVKEVYFLSLEYLVFLGLASYGLFLWKKQLRNG